MLNMHFGKKFISLLIISMLLLSFLPVKNEPFTSAEQLSDSNPPTTEEEAPPFVPLDTADEVPIISDNLSSPIPQQKTKGSEPVELVDQRTETEKVFQNADGTFTKKVYTEAIHLMEDNQWVELSPELKEDHQQIISTIKTELKAHFKKELEEDYATFESEGDTIRFSLKKAKGEKGETVAKKAKASYEENTIKYIDIFTDIDLRSTTFNKTVKEDIILSTYTGHNQFIFELQTSLQPTLMEDGSIIFKNKKDEVIFTLPTPYMSDSNFNEESGDVVTSSDVFYSIQPIKKNLYELTLTADVDWLKSPERIYPIYIDPSITTDYFENAYVSSRYPTTNYSGDKLWDPALNAYTLRVGYYDATSGTNEALIKPDLTGLEQTDAIIHHAQFSVFASHHYYANNPNGIWLDENLSGWSPMFVNWNNRPTSTNIASTYVGRGQWATFNVTNTVQGWVSGWKSNYGFKLHTGGYGQTYWKKIASAENWTYAPYLEITYSYPKPSKPRVTAYSNGSGSNSGYFDLSWDATPGALGYYVLIFNGYDYDYFPVGNVTNWSTKGKNIWPTNHEIAFGEFNLHDDGLGTEFALDPSPVYSNAYLAGSPYGNYSTAHKYWFRIMVEYPYDYGDFSDETVIYMPLEQVKRPSGSAYTNMMENTGYVSLNWDAVPGATGYKVWMFNGNEYESFDVGNVTTWTTQNKKIWPTIAEISQGRYRLHHDNNGTELALDPSSVYRNSGNAYYASHKNYWFRVTAYSNVGYPESEISLEFKPNFSTSSLLGRKDYWAMIPVPGGTVTAFNGNFVRTEVDFELSGRGPGIAISRTYNSQDTGNGLFGIGWYSSLEENVTEETNGNILYTEADKGTILFTKVGDNQYQAPNGIYLEMKKTSTGFEMKDKSQLTTVFASDGKKLAEKDIYGNQVTYNYNQARKLTSIKDASNRVVNISYKGSHIETIKGPDSRTVSYFYDGDYLKEMKTPENKKYGYDYGSEQPTRLLKYIYQPKGNGTLKTTYLYAGNELATVTDSLENATIISYNDALREVTVTDPKGIKDRYSYNIAGNLSKIVADTDTLKLTTTYEYQANNLTKKTNPKDQGIRVSESYTYDGKGNVTSATDNIGTDTYTYNANNDVTEIIDAEGKTTNVTYNGTNAVSATTNDANQVGMTSSVLQYNQHGNLIALTDSLAMGANLFRNPSFESTFNANDVVVLSDNNNGTVTRDTSTQAPGGLSGEASLKIVSNPITTNWGFIAATQKMWVAPNQTYTLSGWLKTANLIDSGVFFNVELLDRNGYPVANQWRGNRYSRLTGNNDWMERQLTFRTTADTYQVRVYMQIEHQNTLNKNGTVWLDNIQLEEGTVSSASYNPVLNSSFEESLLDWSLYSGTATIDTSTAIDGGLSIKLSRQATTDAAIIPLQRLMINQKKEQPITLTGMSKAEGVKFAQSTGPNKDYAIIANVIYQDGSIEVFEVPFASGTHDWQRSAVTIDSTKPITRIDIHPLLRGEATGVVWYDAIRVIDGNVLSKQVYDTNGNYVTKIIDEVNGENGFTYDTYGNKKTATDAKGQITSYTYNKDHQLENTTLPNNTVVSYQYDLNGNIEKRIIAHKEKTRQITAEYDTENKLKVYKDALSKVTEFDYDDNGNLIETRMPNGNVLAWEYDTANRVKFVKRNNLQVFKYDYDANGNETKVEDISNGLIRTKEYDTGNRIKYMTDRGGSVSWAYHDKSYKIKEATVTHGTYTNKTTYQYNGLDQITEVTNGGKIYHFDYDEYGNVRTYTAGNGSGASFHYDQTQKIDRLTIGDKNGTLILSESYEYDANGNRTKIQQTKGTAMNQGLTTYAYDNLNQLAEEIRPDGTSKTYKYDGFGNRETIITKKGNVATTTTATFNDGNQLKTVSVGNTTETFTYDDNGNRLSDGQFNYQWNAADQLIAVTKKGVSTPFATYQYDDDGRRIEKRVVTGTNPAVATITRYYYDGDSINVLYETDGVGNVLRHYIYSVDGILLAMKTASKTLTYHYNPHGDVIALSDDEGKIVAEYTYDAWGTILSATEDSVGATNPFKYAGYMHDEETNLYYLMARYYQPAHGVFLSVDPDPGDADDPITQNGYTYVNNNPVMLTDPDGHFFWLAVNAGFAAYDAYKAYQSGQSIAKIAVIAASSFIGVGKIKTAVKVVKATKSVKTTKAVKSACNCFTAGTKVLTEDGEKNIEDIEVGDMVLAKSEFDANGELAYKEVTALYTNYRNDLIKLYIGDLLIETTDNHPFWVEGRGWVFADELKAGDKLQKADGSHLTIDKVEFVLLDEPVMVYNFTVADYHTYYVTDLGIWVHNTKCNLELVKENYLKRKGINAHQLKQDVLGAKVKVAHYDIYVNKVAGELYVVRKPKYNKKGELPIPTDVKIK